MSAHRLTHWHTQARAQHTHIRTYCYTHTSPTATRTCSKTVSIEARTEGSRRRKHSQWSITRPGSHFRGAWARPHSFPQPERGMWHDSCQFSFVPHLLFIGLAHGAVGLGAKNSRAAGSQGGAGPLKQSLEHPVHNPVAEMTCMLATSKRSCG